MVFKLNAKIDHNIQGGDSRGLMIGFMEFRADIRTKHVRK